jgi:branched-chain amino acid transport system substrate-binding protein
VALFVSYASDAILFMRTMKSLDYLPTMIIGDSAGFSDPSFLPAVGPISQGLMNRSVWSAEPPGTLAYEVNKLYQAKSNREIDDVSGRDMQAFFVLADAINRAGAADPKKIQAALSATDWPQSAVFIGYRGVKFDETGQNTLGATYLTQLQGKDYATVWPDAPGNAKLAWPMTGWKS